MKSILIILSIILSLSIVSQTKTFTLLDTSLVIGAEFITRQIYFDLGKATLKTEANIVLGSIVTFMNANKNIKLEIQVHSDSRINPNCCDNPTENRGHSITQYLINHNIPSERLVSKGYGAFKLLIKDEKINKAKTKNEKEALHALNRRVVLKIVGVNIN